jgi:hypothetical protein
LAPLRRLIGGPQTTSCFDRTVKHKSQPFAIVISTLLVAALFEPLRRRLQAVSDQRCYWRKYESGRTLAAFGATLHSELEIAQLTEQLLRPVEHTMQPAHCSLWVRPLHPADESGTQDR